MDTSTIAVARLLALDVPRTWQEAVAVAQETAAVLTQAGGSVSPESCVITTVGAVVLSGAGPADASSASSLSNLLAELLEAQTAPSELRALVAPEERGRRSLEELSTALAFFERPNRQADIAALAVRAIAADAQARTDAELERLRTQPTASPREPKAPSEGRSRRPAIAAAIVALAVVAGVAAVWSLRRQPETRPDATAAATAALTGATAATAPSAGPTAPDASTSTPSAAPPSTVGRIVAAATETLNGVADAGLRVLGIRPGAADATEAPPAKARTASTGNPTASPRTHRPASPAGDVIHADAPGAPAPSAVASGPELAALHGYASDTAASLEMSVGVYSHDDADVEPPVMTRPQMPTEPRADRPESDGYLELLVNAQGTVDQVRLRADPSQLHDRMLVSAAKAWQFRPAMKEGRPVRYVVRVPITQ